jgi:hypothetical protein
MHPFLKPAAQSLALVALTSLAGALHAETLGSFGTSCELANGFHDHVMVCVPCAKHTDPVPAGLRFRAPDAAEEPRFYPGQGWVHHLGERASLLVGFDFDNHDLGLQRAELSIPFQVFTEDKELVRNYVYRTAHWSLAPAHEDPCHSLLEEVSESKVESKGDSKAETKGETKVTASGETAAVLGELVFERF